MKLLKESLGNVVLLTLKGEFDSFVTNAFGNEIAKIQDEGIHRIVLNMAQVKFVNSTALGAVIKARKNCRSAQGDVVISSPSQPVRDAMDSLGLDRLFSICEDDAAALAAIEGAQSIELDDDSDSAVMIHVPEVPRPIVGRLKRLDQAGLECRIASMPAIKLADGRELRLKFRLPLYRREYFELEALVDRVEPSAGGVTLGVRFGRMSDEDRSAIESFVSDMNELRKAARGEA
ncbi:MAG TPA: STAS domain-containing protein [Planctomycetota bacterium]|nr:STAS domain-containing protein [Planctomycetota bacterium]